MGFRMRKSIKIAPGIRMNVSKSGVGMSAGVKGARISKGADGRTRTTVGIPGSGISHTTTSSSSRKPSRPPAPRQQAAPAPRPPAPAAPGAFAPKGEKVLFKALNAQDWATIEQVMYDYPDYALVASTLAGMHHLQNGNEQRSYELLTWVFGQGTDPAATPFATKYMSSRCIVSVAPGIDAEMPVNRDAVGLTLAELLQERGDVNGAINIIEQLEPTAVAALSLTELYGEAGRYNDVVEMTNGIRNEDDATALLCVFRGSALRELGQHEAAREAFKEALRSRSRSAIIRHHALLNRAACYLAEGKKAMAKKDLAKITAEDAGFPGVAELEAQIDGA